MTCNYEKVNKIEKIPFVTGKRLVESNTNKLRKRD